MIRGTNYSTGGPRRVTRRAPQVRTRLFGFLTVVTLGSLLLAWITHSLWEQLNELQKDHAAVKGESFYLGVQMRGALRGLNEKLLQFAVSRDPTVREAFLADAADLKSFLATNQLQVEASATLQLLKSADVAKQLELLHQVATNYDAYVTNAVTVFTETNTPPNAESFENVYRQVREISSRLFLISDDLVDSQRDAFGEFLRGTQETLVRHQRLLTISSLVIVGLTLVLAMLVYRGMIAPLKLGLTESRRIIERQEKLAALGTLASGVAHEIRNPLTAIKFRLFSVKKTDISLAENEDLRVIGDEINRLEKIVQHFLQFARPAEPSLTRTDLPLLMREVETLFRRQLESAGVRLKLQADQPVCVYADAQQLKQVLINLVKNAAESIGRNGTITLRLRTDTAELDGRSRHAAILSVQDTGAGIPAEIEARLFDPFFTTKEQGTGLGLAISARIAEKHGGLLRYETELSRGTTFEVVLPAIEDETSNHITD